MSVPNKFYKIGAGQELRRLLSAHIARLDDFGDMLLFPDKTIYSSIISVCKNQNTEMEYANVTSLASLWSGEEQKNIKLRNMLLDENPWRLSIDIEFMETVALIEENGRTLGQVADIFNGIQTSAECPKPVYWFGKDYISL